MRIIKTIIAVLAIVFSTSCATKTLPEPSLAGKWAITTAVGNDTRHWTGSVTLTQAAEGDHYTGLFLWDATDGSAAGTDSVTGVYAPNTKTLTMTSVVISGNIEPVVYTAKVTTTGTIMNGIWTGSSDGSVENPGIWSAKKQ
jgi:hypothetical protein